MQRTSGIYPPYTLPYYIVAPPYRRYSAGVKVLHFLCHALNQRGQKAYILLSEPGLPGVLPLHPRLQTPMLSNDEAGFYKNEGIDPIAIYPELIRGNPLNTPNVVRYLLYFAGAYGGEKRFPESDMIVSYAQAVRDDYGRGDVMTLPVSDPAIYHPPAKGAARKGTCFYSYKHRLHGGKLQFHSHGGIEITKEYPKSARGLANLLRGVELFYAYEDTTLIADALLCGCPAVRLDGKRGFEEFGTDGIAYGTDPAELERARATVGHAFRNYQNVLKTFERQLEQFITKTQAFPMS